MIARARLAVLLAAVLAFAAGAPASADAPASAPAALAGDADVAREHFQLGERLFAVGKFADALGEYQAAYVAYPLPEFLFNIGQCHRNLHNYDQAIFSFEKYLQLKPDAGNRPAVEQLIADLRVERDAEAARQAATRPASAPATQDTRFVAPPLPPPHRPAMTSRWWFWTGVGVAAAVVAGGAYALSRGGVSIPASDLGNLDFPR